MSKDSLSPVLITVYDRLDCLINSINSLKTNSLAKQTDLFIVSDYAYKKEDENKIQKVREYIQNLEGFKSVEAINWNENQGSFDSCYNAMKYVFSKYDRLIIFEDDVIVANKFLEYMNNALNFYKDDKRIMSIAGHAHYKKVVPDDYKNEIYMLKMFSPWGSGIWKDRWEDIDYDIDKIKEFIKNKQEIKEFNKISRHMLTLINDMIGKGVKYGDVIICYNMFKQNKYTIYPIKPLAVNRGHDGRGEHCGEDKTWQKQQFTNDFCPKMVENLEPNPQINKKVYKLFYSYKRDVIEPLLKFLRIYKPVRFIYKKIKRMFMTTTTIQQAKNNNHIIDEKLIIDSECVNVNGGSNYNLRDIFGNYHRFFKPYSHKTIPLYLRTLDNGYCYNYDEIIFTKNKKIVAEHTSLRIHPMLPQESDGSRIKKIYYKLKSMKSYLKFYLHTFRAKKINGSVLLLSRNGLEKNYGHFLIETMINYHLAKNAIKNIDYIILDTSLKFQQEIIELLKIPKEKLISVKDRYLIQAEKLLVPTILADWEYIDLRHYLHYGAIGTSSKITNFYRENKEICNFSKKPSLKLFISRKNAQFRYIENNDNVEKIFKDNGFQIIDDKAIPLKELINLSNQSIVIAGIHGAGLTNIIFAPKNSHIFVLETEYFHDNYFVTLASSLNINYHYMIGETKDTSVHPRIENAYFNENKLKEALKILDKKINEKN